jgi:Rieske Fe-S protein
MLIHTAEGKLKAFSAVCTHLNCTVEYQSDLASIVCACHNGHFDLNGQVISGPPPKPLEEFRVDVRDDNVIVSKMVV